jgi:hypothetical protein
MIFENVSSENTAVALKIAFEKAKELATDIVISTTSGSSAVEAVKRAKSVNFQGKIIIVTHVWGMAETGKNELLDEHRKTLEEAGATIVTAAHALSGTERAMSGKFGGVYTVEIMAHTLRMFCQGVKVCVEIATMALDAGAITNPRPVVSVGGTGQGLDTACVITPGYSAKIFETRIHEILCKPF